MIGEQRVSGSFSDSTTATGHFERRVQEDYDAVSDEMLPERSRTRRRASGNKKALLISRGHSELKVNVPERSPQSEAHCPVRLGRARDRGAGHRAPRRLLGTEVPHPAFTAMLRDWTRERDYNSQ